MEVKKFGNLKQKQEAYKQAMSEGAHTLKEISAWLKEHGYRKQTPKHAGNFIYNQLKGDVRVERKSTGKWKPNKYYLE